MVNQALIDVVKNQLSGGVSESDIREFLGRRGAGEDEIREIFGTLSADAAQPLSEKHIISVEQPIAIEPVAVQTSVAHGVERAIPPLQPSVPFAIANGQQPAAINAAATVAGSGGVSRLAGAMRSLAAFGVEKKRAVFIAATACGVVAALFGAWFAYAVYFSSPDDNLDRVMGNAWRAQSFAFSGQAVIRVNDLAGATLSASSTDPFMRAFAIGGPVTFTSTVSGKYDAHAEASPSLALALAATTDRWSTGDFKLGVDYRNIKRTNYVSFSDVPDFDFLNLGFLKNRWFTASDSDAYAQLGGIAGNSYSIVPFISQERRAAMLSAWQHDRFLTISGQMGSEDIDGVSTWHYLLAMDGDMLVRWMTQVSERMGEHMNDADGAALQQLISRLSFNDIQLWVGKRDGLPHKIHALVGVASADDPAKQSEINITLTADHFNERMDISAPNGAASIDEAMRGIFEQLLDKKRSASHTIPRKKKF